MCSGISNLFQNIFPQSSLKLIRFFVCFFPLLGSLFKDYREEWLSSSPVGQIHHSKWRSVCTMLFIYCIHVFILYCHRLPAEDNMMTGLAILVLFYSNTSYLSLCFVCSTMYVYSSDNDLL